MGIEKDLTKTLSSRKMFRSRLLTWYERNRRDLPWRKDRDPYRIWLSEIMLQQTRVAAVVEHYRKFLKRFPTVQKLAGARQTSVLAAWSGLGYYRRARMLHDAAKQIVREHKGKFPGSSTDLRALPGIGRYTAAAIASIAFGEPVAVVDGNVERVLERMLGVDLQGEELWDAAQSLLSPKKPGDFNQAMMELGATVCLPRHPKCLACPVRGVCASRGEREKATNQGRLKKRQIWYALDCRNGSIFLVRRPQNASLMPGMWELPEISGSDGDAAWISLRHSITITDYVVGVKRARAPENKNGRWIEKRRAQFLPLTGLARKILRAAEVE
jgi:A/G-specific adenine glycosylase